MLGPNETRFIDAIEKIAKGYDDNSKFNTEIKTLIAEIKTDIKPIDYSEKIDAFLTVAKEILETKELSPSQDASQLSPLSNCYYSSFYSVWSPYPPTIININIPKGTNSSVNVWW